MNLPRLSPERRTLPGQIRELTTTWLLENLPLVEGIDKSSYSFIYALSLDEISKDYRSIMSSIHAGSLKEEIQERILRVLNPAAGAQVCLDERRTHVQYWAPKTHEDKNGAALA